jgi:hypothetical protein
MSQHIGVVGCSAEGAALCYRTLCVEGGAYLGTPHAHPEVSMHTHSLATYVECLERGDLDGVARLMLSSSARKLAAAGAQFLMCPDNTIHQAMHLVAAALAAAVAAHCRGGGRGRVQRGIQAGRRAGHALAGATARSIRGRSPRAGLEAVKLRCEERAELAPDHHGRAGARCATPRPPRSGATHDPAAARAAATPWRWAAPNCRWCWTTATRPCPRSIPRACSRARHCGARRAPPPEPSGLSARRPPAAPRCTAARRSPRSALRSRGPPRGAARRRSRRSGRCARACGRPRRGPRSRPRNRPRSRPGSRPKVAGPLLVQPVALVLPAGAARARQRLRDVDQGSGEGDVVSLAHGGPRQNLPSTFRNHPLAR